MAKDTPRTASDVFQFLKNVLVRDFELTEALVVPTAGFEELDLDSIDAVDLTIAVEEEFEMKFRTEDLEGFQKIQDVVDVVVAAPARRA